MSPENFIEQLQSMICITPSKQYDIGPIVHGIDVSRHVTVDQWECFCRKNRPEHAGEVLANLFMNKESVFQQDICGEGNSREGTISNMSFRELSSFTAEMYECRFGGNFDYMDFYECLCGGQLKNEPEDIEGRRQRHIRCRIPLDKTNVDE